LSLMTIRQNTSISIADKMERLAGRRPMSDLPSEYLDGIMSTGPRQLSATEKPAMLAFGQPRWRPRVRARKACWQLSKEKEDEVGAARPRWWGGSQSPPFSLSSLSLYPCSLKRRYCSRLAFRRRGCTEEARSLTSRCRVGRLRLRLEACTQALGKKEGLKGRWRLRGAVLSLFVGLLSG